MREKFEVANKTAITYFQRTSSGRILVLMSDRIKSVFLKLLRKTTLTVREKQRIEILLCLTDAKMSLMAIARTLKVSRNTIKKWRDRYLSFYKYFKFSSIQQLKAGDFTRFLRCIIADAPRSGRSPKFSPEIILHIFAIACEDPATSNRPISHWSAREIAEELKERKIVESISERSVSYYLQNANLKPHRFQYWCNSPDKSQEDFNERVRAICSFYRNAIDYLEQNVRLISMDEKTGIQAKERLYPKALMLPGNPEHIEHNYKKHGTTSLIAGLEVATGKVINPYINSTRTEKDFLEAIKGIVETDLEANYVFIVDNLNTHKSATLVEYITEFHNFTIDLGVKGKSGILQNQETRQRFLEKHSHKISFVYTPKHTSWLNQIEIWFSILSRKLLRRGSFSSIEQLEDKISQFIQYYNTTIAKPFNWTYKGKPLTY